MVERALEYNKDLILDTDSPVRLFGKDFLSLALPPLLSSTVMMPRTSLNNGQTPATTMNSRQKREGRGSQGTVLQQSRTRSWSSPNSKKRTTTKRPSFLQYEEPTQRPTRNNTRIRDHISTTSWKGREGNPQPTWNNIAWHSTE